MADDLPDPPGPGATYGGLLLLGGAAAGVLLLPISLAPRLGLAGFLLARGLAPLPHRLRPGTATWAAGGLTRGAGWVGLAVAGAAALPWTPTLSGLPAGLAAAGLALRHGGAGLEEVAAARRLRGVGAAALAAAVVLVAAGVGVPAPTFVRGVVAAAVAAALATALARETDEAADPRLEGLRHGLAGSMPRNALAGAGLAAVVLARWTLGDVRYRPIYEWGVAVVVASLALERAVDWYREGAPDEAWTSSHERHVQSVDRLAGDAVHRLHEAGRRFLDGDLPPANYAEAWSPVADRVDDADLEAVLADVEAHEDDPEPRLLRLPGRLARVREENRRAREELVDRLHEAIDEGGTPP